MNRTAFWRGLALPFALAAGAVLLAAPPGGALLAAEEKAETKDSGDAQDDPAERKKEEKGKAAAPKVYTNKDLEKYRDLASLGLLAGALFVDTTPPAPAPATAPEEAAALLTPGEKDLLIAQLRGEIAEAEARLAALDRRERSVRNPFLPRPQLTEEERETEAGLDGKEIVQRIQAERAELRQKVASLRDELARVVAAPARQPAEPPLPTPPASPQTPP